MTKLPKAEYLKLDISKTLIVASNEPSLQVRKGAALIKGSHYTQTVKIYNVLIKELKDTKLKERVLMRELVKHKIK